MVGEMVVYNKEDFLRHADQLIPEGFERNEEESIYVMKILKQLSGENPATLQQIESFEEDNNIRLPDQLKSLFMKQNPINTVENSFQIEGREPFDISFFPFSDNSIEWTFQQAFINLYEEFFDSKYVSFGGDSGGWNYVISVQDSDYGKVYFCRMDEELEDALTLLADSLEEFIDGLKPEE